VIVYIAIPISVRPGDITEEVANILDDYGSELYDIRGTPDRTIDAFVSAYHGRYSSNYQAAPFKLERMT